MDAPVIGAIIAGSVATVGWFVSYALTSVSSVANAKRTAALVHIEKQLAELYGPLAFLVLEGRQSFEELLRVLDRKYVFGPNGQISESDLKTWLFWADNDLIPRNTKIQALLSQKTHLLYDSKMVVSYQEFLNHHNSWMIPHLRWNKEQVPYSWHSSINWPKNFEEDVLNAFANLQAEHAGLLHRQHSFFSRQSK